MSDSIRLVLFPMMIAVGWIASRYERELARQLGQAIALATLAVQATVLGSGIFRSEATPDFHRWSGQGMLILVWVGVPLAIGVVAQRGIRTRPVPTVMQIACLLLLLGFTFSANLTGYLGPSSGAMRSEYLEETKNRFVVLHQIFLPTIIVVLLISWWASLRETSPEALAKIRPPI